MGAPQRQRLRLDGLDQVVPDGAGRVARRRPRSGTDGRDERHPDGARGGPAIRGTLSARAGAGAGAGARARARAAGSRATGSRAADVRTTGSRATDARAAGARAADARAAGVRAAPVEGAPSADASGRYPAGLRDVRPDIPGTRVVGLLGGAVPGRRRHRDEGARRRRLGDPVEGRGQDTGEAIGPDGRR
ncbi:hypothetical protein [Pseudonocardia sp. EC080619-01]|uniref:hypothetical protein n=1 Tax=Pseudonocardia sp. EC080619-01 TaxID=1096856 RepID=UPI0007615270|nr:hypothetical protein [Pseudonocardia sp. EC080619-01]